MHLRYENQNVSRCQEQNKIPRIKIVSQNLKPLFRGRYSCSLLSEDWKLGKHAFTA